MLGKNTPVQKILLAMLALCTALTACQQVPDVAAPVPGPKTGLRLIEADWDDLPGWPDPRLSAALAPLGRSCAVMMKKDRRALVGPEGVGGLVADWVPICQELAILPTIPDQEAAKNFFEKWFRPVAVAAENGDRDGLFTGYYEPLLRGSRTRSERYHVPLLRRPNDLITVDLGKFRPEFKNQKIAGRLDGNMLQPYPDRGMLAARDIAALDPVRDVLLWVDNPIDAFFLEIQGSGQVVLEDGQIMHVGYDAQNGHAYVPIGRPLRDMGALPPDQVSMQSIRAWLERHPHRQQEIFNYNPSVVFFREITGDGPLGAQGVALTPGRSLAVDRTLLPYGAPIWLDAQDPIDAGARLQRLMIAQDTGGAIRGAVRGDVFWGAGEDAAMRAGVMKSTGQMWLLLPAQQQIVQKPTTP